MAISKRMPYLVLLIVMLLGVGIATFAAPRQQEQVGSLPSFSNALRADLEIAANDALGQGVRPQDWTSNIDNTSSNYINDLWFDKELLANAIFGDRVRPTNWLGVTVENADIVARNTRYDLEILADNIYGGTDIRPPIWNGADARYRCDRTVQNTIAGMGRFFGFSTELGANAFGYCALIEAELRQTILVTRQLDIVEPELDQEILAVRGDIERLANEVYGVNNRPVGWSGNTDINSALLLTDNYEDLRILADETLGDEVRPPAWLGLITNSKVETWRNLRYDLELVADVVVPTLPSIEDTRPRGWQGTDPLRRCIPRVQDLVLVIESNFADDEEVNFTRANFAADGSYCSVVENAANVFIETNVPTSSERLVQAGGLAWESEYAFAYLDLTALEYMGVMPRGTRFRPWYRNFNDSTMMFVSGQGFALYIDRRWTNLPQDVFDRLPTVEGVRPLTFCETDWCNGPAPTPTPTGGALESLLAFQTPVIPPTPDLTAVLPSAEKTRVNFENVRVTYLQDNLQTRSSQVTLELCQDVQKTVCEPVISVNDTVTSGARAVVGQRNGVNVYEFNWGYTSTVVIETATLISPDIFISDPLIREGLSGGS